MLLIAIDNIITIYIRDMLEPIFFSRISFFVFVINIKYFYCTHIYIQLQLVWTSKNDQQWAFEKIIIIKKENKSEWKWPPLCVFFADYSLMRIKVLNKVNHHCIIISHKMSYFSHNIQMENKSIYFQFSSFFSYICWCVCKCVRQISCLWHQIGTFLGK